MGIESSIWAVEGNNRNRVVRAILSKSMAHMVPQRADYFHARVLNEVGRR